MTSTKHHILKKSLIAGVVATALLTTGIVPLPIDGH
ncbi:MAG: hypothetical protein K0Q63_3412, partial [Paenibacillus sp.]|nr:hypothetical protein [Paenibacillus sp.]